MVFGSSLLCSRVFELHFFFYFPRKGLKKCWSLSGLEIMKKIWDIKFGFQCMLSVQKNLKEWIWWKHTRHYGPLVECMWSNGSQALYISISGITSTIHLWSVNIVDVSAPLAFMKYHAVHRALHFIVLSHRAWYRFFLWIGSTIFLCVKWDLHSTPQSVAGLSGPTTLAKKLRQPRKPNYGACMLERARACAPVCAVVSIFLPG